MIAIALATCILSSEPLLGGVEASAELDVSALISEGGGGAVLVSLPRAPQLRFGVGGERRVAIGTLLTPNNVGWKLTYPMVIEGIVEWSALDYRPELFVGVRAGYLHFHADRIALVGLAEEDWYGLTPNIGWRAELGYGVYLKGWAGYALPIFKSSTQAEIDIAATEKTYDAAAAGLRAAVAVGFALR